MKKASDARIDCSLRIFSSYMAYQPRQPLDSSRFIM